MALRIRPLSEGPSGQSSGLAIRPLTDLITSLPAAAPAAPAEQIQSATPTLPGSYAAYRAQSPAAQQAPYANVGGNGEGSIGASLGFGLNGSPTTADVAFSFGHLAGPSPASAALAGFSPTLASALGLGPNLSGTPAGILGSIYGNIPGPLALSMVGPISAAMQQAVINQAMQIELQNTALRESMAPMSFRGGIDSEGPTGPPPGPPAVSQSVIDAVNGIVNGIVADSLGLGQNTGLGLSIGQTGTDPGPPSGEPSGGATATSGSGGGPGEWHTGGPVTKGAPKGPERKARLLEGEFVVRKEPAQMHRPLLEAINRGEPPKKLRKLLDYMMEPMEEKAKA